MQAIRKPCLTVALAALLAAAVAAPRAQASIVLSDQNTTAVFDLDAPTGLSSWTIDGTEQLGRQWFWYRVGGCGGEASLDSLTLDASRTGDMTGDGIDDALYAKYLGAGFTVELTYILAGGGSDTHTADLLEMIRITNTGPDALDFHFFQYADFNLGGDGASDSVQISGSNAAVQTDGTLMLAETVVGPTPSAYDVGLAADLLLDLTDTCPSLLDNTAQATGDVAWAFQWDAPIAPGDVLIISKDKNVVPEPATLALVALGGLALAMRRR